MNQELLEALRGVMKFEEIEEWATSTDEWLDEVLAKSIDERILQEAGAIKAARTAILNATK